MAKRVLVVGGCPAPYHRLEPVVAPITDCLVAAGFDVTVTGIYHPDGGDAFVGDYSAISAENLAGYDALLLYTTGAETHGADVDAIVSYVKGGGALLGIHNAADSFTANPDFVKLIGGKFRTHPAPLDVTFSSVAPDDPIVAGIADFTVLEELYLFADYDPQNVHLLAQTTSYDDNGAVPVCWTREEGAGRVFYTSLGHFPETMSDASWITVMQRGARWACRVA